MLPGDRLVCAFVRPITPDAIFQVWPLHVTVVPWFRLGDTTDAIALGIAAALTPIAAFVSFVDGEARMGPHKNRPAVLIGEPTPFRDIEQRVRTYFHKKRAWLVDETTKRPRSFRPHVTNQKIDRLQVDNSFQTDCLYIVEQKGNFKQVVGEVPLRNE